MPNPNPLVAKFVDTVLSYQGTPWRHQARVPGLGLDCGGVHVCAAQAVGLPVHDHAGGYKRMPDGKTIQAILAQDLVLLPTTALADMRPGDVLLFDTDGRPGHLGTYVGNGEIVDSWSTFSVRKVTRHRLDPAWKVVGVYRWPDIEESV